MSTIILVLIFFICFIAPSFYSVSAYALNPQSILLPPSFEHLLGTDRLGRDVLARLMLGGQVSLTIGILSAMVASFLGLAIGISAGFFQRNVDKSIIVLIDLFLTFPTFFLLLALVSYMSASLWVLIFIISITGWMGMARLIHVEKMLSILARKHPVLSLFIQIEDDDAIPENNGYYIVENGNCYREYREGREYHLYTIESLTAKSFETEHPYMSLMLN